MTPATGDNMFVRSCHCDVVEVHKGAHGIRSHGDREKGACTHAQTSRQISALIHTCPIIIMTCASMSPPPGNPGPLRSILERSSVSSATVFVDSVPPPASADVCIDGSPAPSGSLHLCAARCQASRECGCRRATRSRPREAGARTGESVWRGHRTPCSTRIE